MRRNEVPAAKKTTTIDVPELERERIEFTLVGETPLILESMSVKAKQELLMPTGRKTAAMKRTSLKHDPVQEFQDSVYRMEDGPTAIGFPAPAFKAAMVDAAKEIPGVTGEAIKRLVRVSGYRIPVYGVPQIFTTVVRMADIKKTPDVRTRAILAEWACVLAVEFVRPNLTHTAIANIVSGAGQIIGVGGFRQGKGAGDFGLWVPSDRNDARFKAIVKAGGRKAQESALADPEAFDPETAELLGWYDDELTRRGIRAV